MDDTHEERRILRHTRRQAGVSQGTHEDDAFTVVGIRTFESADHTGYRFQRTQTEVGVCLLRERLFWSLAGDSHLLGQRVWSVETFTEEKDFADLLEQPWRMDGTAL